MRYSIEKWVDGVDGDPDELQLRQAVHTVLKAVGESEQLRGRMLMKGGMLLAIHYGSNRFTRDIDFSTTEKTGEFDIDKFIDSLCKCSSV